MLKTTYDGAERANAVSGTLGTQQTNYVGSVQYTPHGAPNVYQYGNNVWPVNTFDTVLRPYQAYSTVGNNPNYWLLYITNAWNTNGTLNSLWEGYGPGVPYANMTWYNDGFGYDHLNRLTSAGDAGWSRTFTYDQYGNMSVTSNSNVPLNGLTPQILQAPYNPYNANNQLVAGAYDAAGNLGTIGALSFWYDAEGRQIQSYDAGSHTTAYYTYDADGQRVQKALSNGPTTIYIQDAFGNLAAEYASSAPTPPCTTCYLSYDHLGSVRLITDQNANVVTCGCCFALCCAGLCGIRRSLWRPLCVFRVVQGRDYPERVPR